MKHVADSLKVSSPAVLAGLGGLIPEASEGRTQGSAYANRAPSHFARTHEASKTDLGWG